MAFHLDPEDAEPGFQIAPMIDVVFVLMIFFMLSASFQPKERYLEAKAPGGIGRSATVAAVVDITEEGLVLLNDKPYGQPEDRSLLTLRRWFKDTAETFGTSDPVILRPSPGARHDRVVQVLACVNAANLTNVAFK